MEILYVLVLIINFIFLSFCSEKGNNKLVNQTDDDTLSDISIYKEGNNFDSLESLLDFAVSDSTITKTEDSIEYLYGQLQARLAIAKGDSDLKQVASEFYTKLKSSKNLYDSLVKVDAQILGYSYYRATEAGEKERNMYYSFLKQRLFFMKCILENTYWNYGFDKINN